MQYKKMGKGKRWVACWWGFGACTGLAGWSPQTVAQWPMEQVAVDRDVDGLIRAMLATHPEALAMGREAERMRAQVTERTRWAPTSAKGYYLPQSDIGDRYHEWEVSQSGWMPGGGRIRTELREATVEWSEAEVRVYLQAFAVQTWDQAILAWGLQRQLEQARNRWAGARRWAQWYADRAEAGLETRPVATAAAFQEAQASLEVDRLTAAWERSMSALRSLGGAAYADWEQVELPERSWADGPVPLPDSAAAWAQVDARWEAAASALRTAEHERDWQQRAALPQWELGWNQQGVPGAMYRGAMAGVVVPLAGRKAGVEQAAIAQLQAQDRWEATRRALVEGRQRDLRAYETLRATRNELARQLDADGTEEALDAALRAGSISFPAFWTALEARRSLEDALIQLDVDLLQLQGQILQHMFP